MTTIKKKESAKKKVDLTSTTELNYQPNFNVNYLKYKRFSEIVKSKGLSNSLVIRQFIDSIIDGENPQKPLF